MDDANAGARDLPALPPRAAAQLQDHLMSASSDLDRLQALLSDACRTLMQRFNDAAQQLSGLRNTRAAGLADDSTLNAVTDHLRGAVVALQFEDLASQLIGHTHGRLRRCADELARGAPDDGATPASPTPALRPNPVTQSEMDAGSVELF